MNRSLALSAVSLALVSVALSSTRRDGMPAAWSALNAALQLPAQAAGAVDEALYSLTGYRLMEDWRQAAERPENRDNIALARAAEARYGIPKNLFVRLLWQESRYDPNAYNASSGASGIAQIVPYWHPGVNPWNPAAAIDYGARYLAQLFRQFGTWELALKAYNWGPGNVQKWLDSDGVWPPEPDETRRYSAQILADVRASGVIVA